MKSSWSFLVTLFFLSGCAMSCGAYEDVEGSLLNIQTAAQFTEHKTTQKDVLQGMRAPALAVTWKDGSEILKYRWISERVSTRNFAGIVIDTYTYRAQQSMIFKFKDGVMVSKEEEFFTYWP